MARSLYARLRERYGPKVDGPSRREVLKASLAASAGILLSSCKGKPVKSDPASAFETKQRIIVVGGGLAGLAAAYELLSVGYKVHIYEARERLGGRVISYGDFVPGKIVEGGGEFIGANHPTWLGYAKQFGLGLANVTEDRKIPPIILNGKKLDERSTKALTDEMTAAFATLNAAAAKIDEEFPWKSDNSIELDQISAAQWVAGLKVSADCRKLIQMELEGTNGVALARMSYLGLLTMIKGGGLEKYWTESESHRCIGGNQQLTMKLTAALGPDRISRKSPVVAIRAKEGGAMVVSTADGEPHECDDVVLTVPPSVWKKIHFFPELPPGLQPQMGTALKYLARVKEAYWARKTFSPSGYTDLEVSSTWDATDKQGAGPAALCAFSGGPVAESARKISKEDRDKRFGLILEALLPGFAENFEQSRFMDWPGDPWLLAGYSFPGPGEVTTIGPVLREPYGQMHFAGEHCCLKFVGYMEGALYSGATVARYIAQRDGVIKA